MGHLFHRIVYYPLSEKFVEKVAHLRMTAQDISRSALTTLLALVPRDTEIQVWPIERSTDGPATLHITLEHIGRDTITAILIDAGILTVKNHHLALKKFDNLISPTIIMTFLADDSPIKVDARSTIIKGSRNIFWTIRDRKIVIRGRRRSSLASPDSSMSTFDSFDDIYIKDVIRVMRIVMMVTCRS